MATDAITINDIDPVLVERIMRAPDFTFATRQDATAEMDREYIAAVLLYITKHPITPSMEEALYVSEVVVGPTATESYLQRCLTEFQRRVFLKKAVVLPDAVKEAAG